VNEPEGGKGKGRVGNKVPKKRVRGGGQRETATARKKERGMGE